jgi:hypothetical protein
MSSEKIEAFWQDATAKDIEQVMAGETVEARFWDNGLPLWSYQTLSGWQTTGVRPLWHSHDGFVWTRCQVYREPSWHAKKPDPGPRHRLLGKFPDESREVKDDVFVGGKWLPARWDDGKQSEGIWYRRRIEAVEDPAGDWEPTDEEFQYAQDLCRVPKGTHDPVDFRKFVDKARAGELSFTCSFVWEGPEPIRVKVGDRIQHPNGCWLEITESGFKIEAALNTIQFTG